MPEKRLIFNTNLLIAGNQAADLDSAVSAFALAELIGRLNPELNVTPLIQGAFDDLSLKPEIEGLFTEAGTPLEAVSFQRSLQNPGGLLPEPNSRLILVDHNEKDPGLPDLPLAGIVDHHRDSGRAMNLPLRDIRICGSCASIISEYWSASGEDIPGRTALLLAGAIAVDTGYLDPHWGKTTELDSREYSRLTSLLSSGEKEYVAGLLKLKNDLSHLTMADHLRRDYKDFSIAGLSGGIASLTINRKEFMKAPFYSPRELDRFKNSCCRDFLMLLHSYGTPLKREISLYDPEDKADKLYKALACLESRGVEAEESEGPWSFYSLKDPKISRKVLMPLLTEALKS